MNVDMNGKLTEQTGISITFIGTAAICLMITEIQAPQRTLFLLHLNCNFSGEPKSPPGVGICTAQI